MRARFFLVVASATIVGACSSVPSAAIGTPTAVLGATERSPSPVASTSPIPLSWVAYINRTGQFSFSAPADWAVNNCEDQDGAYVVAEHGGLSPVCGRGEYYQAWLFAVSLSGDQRNSIPPNGGNYFYAAPPDNTTEVLVDGVKGERYTDRINTTRGGFPPPQGTDQVYYVLFNGTRTYAFSYEHWPADPDRTGDFDRLVQQTLRLSA